MNTIALGSEPKNQEFVNPSASLEIRPMNHHVCGELFLAAKALMEKSRLVLFRDGNFHARTDECEFEKNVAEQLDPQYGRYMAWVLFSVGAENLAKAACLCTGVVPVSPTGHYGAMEMYLRRKNGRLEGRLIRFGRETGLTSEEQQTLTDGYLELIKIRNRDVHSYVYGVRQLHFRFAEAHFVPAFNVLVDIMQCNGHF